MKFERPDWKRERASCGGNLRAKDELGPTRKIVNRSLYVVAGIAMVVFLLLMTLMISVDRIRERSNPFYTYYSMVGIAEACEEYKSDYGKWPTNITQLDFKFGGSPAKDAWGNNIIFVPYAGALDYGQLISYGRDGKPGGSGLNRDWVLRFPMKENYAWDKRQATEATDFRGWTNYNWFDGILSGKYM
jgi:hypothetical protein